MRNREKKFVKSDDSKFELLRTVLRQIDKHGGRSAKRTDVKRAFNGGNEISYQYIRTPYDTIVIHRPEQSTIQLGCQRFAGKNYLKLKKWANG